jgi:hypothetical protein
MCFQQIVATFQGLLWLTNQFEPAKELFKKYLDISK